MVCCWSNHDILRRVSLPILVNQKFLKMCPYFSLVALKIPKLKVVLCFWPLAESIRWRPVRITCE